MKRNIITLSALIAFLLLAGTVWAEKRCEDVYREGKLNINTASVDAISMLPDITPQMASRIIDFREANGPFADINDLTKVKGMGFTVIDDIRPYIKLSGSSSYTVQCYNPNLWERRALPGPRGKRDLRK